MPTPFNFPPVLDASIITQFKACPRQMWFNHIRRVQRPVMSVHLVAGNAFAMAVERARRLWYEQDERDPLRIRTEALRTLWQNYPEGVPIETRHKAKSPVVLAEGLIRYLDHFDFVDDNIRPVVLPSGRAGIEFTFAVPLPIKNPQTGDPILYGGRLDMLAETVGTKTIWASDDKTTGLYGPNWSNDWNMRYQFLGYMWGCAEYGVPVAGMLVRGLHLTLSEMRVINDTKLFPRFKVERWHEQMLRDVQDIVRAWETNVWGYDFSSACTSYGGCQFVAACDHPDHEQAIINERYVPNEWTPLREK